TRTRRTVRPRARCRVDRHADAKLTVYGGGCTKLARSEHSKVFQDTHPDVACVAAADLATIAISIGPERRVHGWVLFLSGAGLRRRLARGYQTRVIEPRVQRLPQVGDDI